MRKGENAVIYILLRTVFLGFNGPVPLLKTVVEKEENAASSPFPTMFSTLSRIALLI